MPGASAYRSMGRTKETMYISVVSNLINVIGNYIGVFVLKAGVAGVAQSIWSLAAVCSSAMGPVFFTVIGQQMGAGDIDAAKYYFRKLMKINLTLSVLWNALILAVTPLILMCFSLSAETKHLVWILVILHNLFNGLALPFSGNLGNGLRAAGEVRFTMLVSIASTSGGRLLFSYIFAIVFNMGVIGIAFAMCLDWCIRSVIFIFRFRSDAWTQFHVI